jgi:hypothetical protein
VKSEHAFEEDEINTTRVDELIPVTMLERGTNAIGGTTIAASSFGAMSDDAHVTGASSSDRPPQPSTEDTLVANPAATAHHEAILKNERIRRSYDPVRTPRNETAVGAMPSDNALAMFDGAGA